MEEKTKPAYDLFNMPNHLQHFNGSDYIPKFDQSRLKGQMKRLYDLMIEGGWFTLSELESELNRKHPGHNHPAASLSAQMRHLRKERFGSHIVEKRCRGERANGLFEYLLLKSDKS